MFSLREFIKKGLLNAVGKMADYQIILNAGGWFNQSVLTQDDLAEINEKIEEQYAVVENVEEYPEEENEEIINE